MATLVAAHSVWRWAVLLTALAAIAGGIVRRDGVVPAWTGFAGLGYTIAIDLQVAIGIALWIVSSAWRGSIFFAVIHPVSMLLALAAAHWGRRLGKEAATGNPDGRAVLAYTLSLVLLLLGIPRLP